MFRERLAWLLPSSALLLLSGCATLSEGTRQDVVVALPEGMSGSCTIRAANGRQLHQGASPLRATLNRGRQTLKAECEREGGGRGATEIKPSFASRARIQAPLGYAVDGMSGAMWSYPAEVTVPVS